MAYESVRALARGHVIRMWVSFTDKKTPDVCPGGSHPPFLVSAEIPNKSLNISSTLREGDHLLYFSIVS